MSKASKERVLPIVNGEIFVFIEIDRIQKCPQKLFFLTQTHTFFLCLSLSLYFSLHFLRKLFLSSKHVLISLIMTQK